MNSRVVNHDRESQVMIGHKEWKERVNQKIFVETECDGMKVVVKFAGDMLYPSLSFCAYLCHAEC